MKQLTLTAVVTLLTKVIKIRAVPENRKKERVYWLKDLLADNGRPEIEAFVNSLKQLN